MNLRKRYPLKNWRPFFDIGLCYLIIALAIYGSLRFPVMYLLSIFIIANRILALSLICHEGLHGNLFLHPKLNNFVGRWLCAFPTFISFSKYRKLHLLHHRTLGHEVADPDKHLYDQFPMSLGRYLWHEFINLITLKTCYKFIIYYTEFPEILNSKDTWRNRIKKIRVSGDFVEFFIFYIALVALLIYLGVFKYFVIFINVPLFFIVQPYVLLMGGLQHGPIQKDESLLLKSRSIRGPKWLMEILLPLDINYHAEHHYNSNIPHYWLKDYSKELEEKGEKIWNENYSQAVNNLFT